MRKATPSVSHAPGDPCPVIDLLHSEFGQEYGEYLLWEFTCFPFSDDYAMEQARDLVQAKRMGRLNAFLQTVREEQELSMWRAAERAQS
jgi:hypothetical protein